MKRNAFLAGMTALLLGLNSVSVLAEQGTPPEPPSGDMGGTPPDMPGGAPPEGGGGFGGANTQTYDYSGTLSGTLTADAETLESDGEDITSDTSDVVAALASNGGTLTITNSALNKSGDDNDGDACNFYGVNAIALSVNDGSMLVISDSTLNADSVGSNAIFATDNATAYANNVEITTSADNSRGLDATYGGTIIGKDVTITTQGDHCAATATDRGGGNISVVNGTFETNGSGSPLIYSTGDIEVSNVTGTATGSQIAGMEGLNTILINNSDLTSTITQATASDPVANGIILYQSTSGDAETSTGNTAVFQVVDSKLTSSIASGAMFYVTNTNVNVLLKNSEVNFDSNDANLFYIAGNNSNNWGSAGSNGANVTFSAISETLNGNITVDTISLIDAYLLENTTYTGAISIETNDANTNTTDAPATMNIDSTSKWIVTGNSTVTNLNVEEGGEIVDENGNVVTITVNGETVVEGTSEYTVTVTSAYSNEVTLTEANEIIENNIDRSEFEAMFEDVAEVETTPETEENTVEEETTNESETIEEVEEVTEEKTTNNTGIIVGGVAVVAIAAIVILRKVKKS